VTKLTNFGVFVELEPGLEGLLHISELSDAKIESPEEVVKVRRRRGREGAARRCQGPQDRAVDGGTWTTPRYRRDAITEHPERTRRPRRRPASPGEAKPAAGGQGQAGAEEGPSAAAPGRAGPLFQLPGEEDKEDKG